MGLHEAAMGLRLDAGQLDLVGWDAEIEPGRHIGHRQAFFAIEQQLADNLLHPGGTGLGVGGDDDVIVAKWKIIPDGGIEMVAFHLSGFFRGT